VGVMDPDECSESKWDAPLVAASGGDANVAAESAPSPSARLLSFDGDCGLAGLHDRSLSSGGSIFLLTDSPLPPCGVAGHTKKGSLFNQFHNY